ncbi:LuxR C-terminal-related transcriptional regulator [Conexibacter woesei]|uniref:ATP-dependent transcriptional regulator, MalT-like, LuxR family n=1 Tax=Conexibacter woesei (strain DSM 14684 / CCUG 47730 / CIP 108061 / JCM 11494 / NBRC 100937 / ID131577) TaxID=469383 RepID=D3EZX6_CONWI|nr:LuxR C-terminal-related transcriptional regulator [Conexibacter woesei]ADB49952.1 ATP-dependent transcriptional regulator, MalT- like, LuxR family [Conexibacter woesei DSM 14684]
MGQTTRSVRPNDTIATKLAPPCPPVAPVRRERLFRALAHGSANGVTLVSAPAGAGKTALVASWLASGAVAWPVAWLALDGHDDERRRFWTGVLAALARADPSDAGLAQLAVPPRGRIDRVFTELVERLAARTRPLVLVLDDVHELTDGAIHDDLAALLRHAPAALRLVLIARADPPLGLERLRVSGRLSEIRAADLAFDAAEARELLAAWGAPLDAVDARELWRRSGGWAAGLVLPALALRDHADPSAFVAGFGGDDRAVADFVLTEMLAGHPGDVRRFLLRTAVAEELTVELAVELGGRPDAAELLERLVHGNALVERLDGGRDGYRYGPLFAGLLRSELARTAPEELAELHLLLARWHERDGVPGAAVRHALAASAWELAAEAVADGWLRLLLDGELELLREVAERMPPALHRRWPEVALACAAAATAAGDAAGAATLLARAEDAAEDASGEAAGALPPARALGFARGQAVVELLLGRVCGDVERTTRAAAVLTAGRRAVPSGDGDAALADELRVAALAHLGATEAWCGELEAAAQRLDAALAGARERELDAIVLLARAHLALGEALRGRLVRAADGAAAALELAERHGWDATPAAATAQAVLASALLHWDRTEEADRVLARAERTVRSSGEPPLRALVALVRIGLLAADGAWDAAIARLRAAEAELRSWPLHAPLRARFAAHEALLRAARGERAEAGALLESARAAGPRPEHAAALGRLRLAAGEPASASAAVEPWLEQTVPRAVAVELWTTEAVARDALDDDAGACCALERALALAEPDGFRHELLALGPSLRDLLARTIRAGTAHRSFAGELLDALEHDGARPLALPEPLSGREEAVLRCLPTMMSNREIATELYVSVNTVKTHLKHIYRKLDAADRREAVRRARELQLLAPSRDQTYAQVG